MSHHIKLRTNKRCENCGHFVEKRFCPECGQENVETRMAFYHLFWYFVKDFLHYDGKFWKTILYLLFYPAKLTKEYLAGKRKQYVHPVKLYIFISCITFLILAILPNPGSGEKRKTNREITTEVNEAIAEIQKDADFQNMPQNIQETAKYSQNRKLIGEIFKQHFPKAIFLYMPIFAFWLWLFHGKKKWFYFDHGIYTLHYFSFILLSFLLYILLDKLLSLFHLKAFSVIIAIAMPFWFIYYFFHSNRLVYQESKAVSRLKCTFLFILNTICVMVFLLLFVVSIGYVAYLY
jgi:hypothetical protein